MYAVLLDIDGTLLNSGGAGSVAFAEVFWEVFQVKELPAGVAFAGRSDRAIAEEIMQRSGIEPSAANWKKFFTEYCQRIENALDVCEGVLLPGVVELLDALQKDEHAVVGLLTGNTEFGAQAKTTAYGLEGRFAFGGFGDARTERNEIAGDAWVAAEKYVGRLDAEGTLCGAMVIGDTPADVACGRAIGAFVVAVATGGASREELAACEPDLLLDDLTDTEALLAEVQAAERRCLEVAGR